MRAWIVLKAWKRNNGAWEWSSCGNLHTQKEIAEADARLQQLQHPDEIVLVREIELPTPHEEGDA